jgi:HSP20 family protein
MESPEEILIRLEVPGLEEQDLRLDFQDGVLALSGERKREKDHGMKYLRCERRYGRFFRSFRLPATACPEKISAALRNGVMTVTVPKKEEARAKKIDVSVM